MATTLCSAADVAGYLGLTLSASSKPTDTQVEAWINRVEQDIYTRTGRYFTTGSYKQVTNETKDMNYVYNYGLGVRINLLYRNTVTFDYAQGDRIQFWNGSNWQDILTSGNSQLGTEITQDTKNGWVFLKGHLYTSVRVNRFRFTYRYGETVIPEDIKSAAIYMTVYHLLRIGALFWKVLPLSGDNALRDLREISKSLKEDADDIISRYAELVPTV